jgi:hypothetical protein
MPDSRGLGKVMPFAGQDVENGRYQQSDGHRGRQHQVDTGAAGIDRQPA